MARITVDLVMSYEPCQPDYSRERVKELFSGRKYINPKTVLKMDIPVEDRLWLLLRNDFVSEKNLRLFACDCAERVLHIYEKKYDNPAPRKAIETARLFANGEATQEELAAAWDAARAAARAAAWAAARAAAKAAARAWAAARVAARDAEQQWQLERLEYYL